MKEALSSYFSNVSDPRSMRNQRHPFITLIGTSLLAALSGIDSFRRDPRFRGNAYGFIIRFHRKFIKSDG